MLDPETLVRIHPFEGDHYFFHGRMVFCLGMIEEQGEIRYRVAGPAAAPRRGHSSRFFPRVQTAAAVRQTATKPATGPATSHGMNDTTHSLL